MKHPKSEWRWFGDAGHLIVGHDCRFHLCTKVGPWLISTVGKYFPDESLREITARIRGIILEGKGDERRSDFLRKIGYEEIGADRLYETMVFRAGTPCDAEGCHCGMPIPDEFAELDFAGYNEAGEATRGHMDMCEKWAERESAPEED
jgi:hypothetical protein